MKTFEDFKIKKQLLNALTAQGIETPTPIQEAAYSSILAGQDFVGIAQTGTGKTLAYLLPILQDLKYSDQYHPRVLILVPTRELVIQMVDEIKKLTEFINIRTIGVYGGTNIKPQKDAIAHGCDIIVGTPRRLYDLALTSVLNLGHVKKLVIDEVDIMLDFGYKTQLNNIFDYIKTKRQNLLFSATMTTYVDELISEFLVNPVRQTISISGTPLDTITQESYPAPNFYTKANLLNHLLQDAERFNKVLIFMDSKSHADLLAETLEVNGGISVIHSSKEQNHRMKSIERFVTGESRILIATDVIARGVDIDQISTVISFDTPVYPENYIHRIGRTGRAGQEGNAILLFSPKEVTQKEAIENLMRTPIPVNAFPKHVDVSTELTPEERPKPADEEVQLGKGPSVEAGASFHEKKDKNKKENQRKNYEKILKEKYKKPIRRGDKIQNMKSKRKKK